MAIDELFDFDIPTFCVFFLEAVRALWSSTLDLEPSKILGVHRASSDHQIDTIDERCPPRDCSLLRETTPAIGRVRADGFHSLTTLYQTIAAHDLVTIEAHRAGKSSITLTSNDARVPLDERNTAFKSVKAALGTAAEAGIHAEVHIHIDKRLPVQGGLGAGSANAGCGADWPGARVAARGTQKCPGRKGCGLRRN